LIKKAAFRDLKEICKIELENFVNPWNYNMFVEEYNRDFSHIFVYWKDGIIAAYMVVVEIADDELEIYNISVRKGHRKMGLASAMLTFLLGNSVGKTIFLEVRDDNIYAIKLYRKFGFSIMSVRKNYYTSGVDAYVMKLYVEGVQDVKNESGYCPGVA
jgi:ribosomal-protein-alanine N-acetyltransferase